VLRTAWRCRALPVALCDHHCTTSSWSWTSGRAVGTGRSTDCSVRRSAVYPVNCAACGGRVELSGLPYGWRSAERRSALRAWSMGCARRAVSHTSRLTPQRVFRPRRAPGQGGQGSPHASGDPGHPALPGAFTISVRAAARGRRQDRGEVGEGTVFQSATADRLMRLIRYSPELADVLASGSLYGSRPGGGADHPALPRSAIL